MTHSPIPTSPTTRVFQPQAGTPPLLSEQEFVRLRDVLATYCGIYLDVMQQRVVEQALAQRMTNAAETFVSYEQRLLADRNELRQLAERILNHETYFFRNQPHLRALREVLLPELHRRKPPGEPIRIWSAGCATGEEAYSLALAALEALPLTNRPIEIWATDLSSAALATAQTGVYAGRSLSQVEPGLLNRYFTPSGNGYQVSEQVRALVEFERLNLLDPLPARVQAIDIVFCQNVLIYFQQATSQAFLGQLFIRLPEGALLFLGFSETLWSLFNGFHTREVLGAYVYYKEAFSATPVVPAKPAPRAKTAPLVRVETRTERVENATVAVDSATNTASNQPKRRGTAELRSSGITAGSEQAGLNQAQTLLALARQYADRGQLDLALVEAETALALDPMHSEAALLVGVLRSRQGQWAAAATHLERARYLNPTAPLISFHLAEVLRQDNRTSYALREYRNAWWKLEAYPPDIVLDGVTVGWLRDTCQRQITQLSQQQGER